MQYKTQQNQFILQQVLKTFLSWHTFHFCANKNGSKVKKNVHFFLYQVSKSSARFSIDYD